MTRAGDWEGMKTKQGSNRQLIGTQGRRYDKGMGIRDGDGEVREINRMGRSERERVVVGGDRKRSRGDGGVK